MSEFLEEVFGQREVKLRLQRLFHSGRIPNGLLLVGEHGRGKTTLARAFAAVLLAGDEEGRVDLRSPAGRKLAAGSHPDLEIVASEEGKRLLGIDRIRLLKESFGLTAVEGGRRVAVVVAAERLTDEAGNALLKLLEEPPPQAHLILCARSRQAVMETLVSRCLVIPVPPLSTHETREFLRSRGLEEERAHVLAALADGCPGRALELARDDFDRNVAVPAAQVLLRRGPPMERALAATALIKDGARDQEETRERLRSVLGLLISAWRDALHHLARGGEERELPFGPDPEEIRALGAGGIERRLRELLAVLSDLERNVAVDLLLESLVFEWSVGLATI